jgi:copper chaperone CopZ
MHTMTPATDQSAIVCQRFDVIGMTCGHCEHAIARELGALPGVTAITADAAAGTVTIEASRELDAVEIAAAVDEAGYELAR